MHTKKFNYDGLDVNLLLHMRQPHAKHRETDCIIVIFIGEMNDSSTFMLYILGDTFMRGTIETIDIVWFIDPSIECNLT